MALVTTLEKKEDLIRELYSWEAPERFWKPKEKSWYVSYGTFFIVIIALFALLSEYIAIMAVLAFLFLWFVQGAIPPENTTFIISGLSITAFGRKYKWKDIQYFWFSETKEALFLNLDISKSDFMKEGRIHRISLLIPTHEQRETIFYILIKYLEYGEKEEIGYNFLNKIAHGNYVDINEFLPEDVENKEEMQDAQKFADEYKDLTPREITMDEKKEAIKIAKAKIKKKTQAS